MPQIPYLVNALLAQRGHFAIRRWCLKPSMRQRRDQLWQDRIVPNTENLKPTIELEILTEVENCVSSRLYVTLHMTQDTQNLPTLQQPFAPTGFSRSSCTHSGTFNVTLKLRIQHRDARKSTIDRQTYSCKLHGGSCDRGPFFAGLMGGAEA